MIVRLSTLLLVGIILSYARWRSGSLWFGVGLHAGWIIIFRLFSQNYLRVGDESAMWFFGKVVKDGVFPLVMLIGVLYVLSKYGGHIFKKTLG